MTSLIFIGLLGFVLGAFIPLISRRFGKIYPCDAITFLLNLWYFKVFKHQDKSRHLKKYHREIEKLATGCILWGLMISLLTLGLNHLTEGYIPIGWLLFYVWFLGMAASLDARYQVIPDLMTFPFIILGLMVAVLYQQLSPIESVLSSLLGFGMPIASSVLLHRFKPHSIGFGDIKLLSGVGAWLGVLGLMVAILVSLGYFLVMYYITKQKEGPYAPALFWGGLVALYVISL